MPRINLVRIVATTVALFLVVGVLAGCSKSASKSTDQSETSTESQADQLVILDWTGFDLPDYWSDFVEQYPDVAVDFTYFEQDADALAKMQSGFEVDLVHPCSNWWRLYVDAGLVQPIDTSRLTHWSDVTPAMAELGQIDGQQYFVPYDWGYESILVRSDKIDPLPTSWADLWNPAYEGRLSIPDVADANQAMAALALGIEDPWSTTPDQDEAIKQKLIDLKPEVLTYWVDSTELAQMMASGDVWIASGVWQDIYGALVDEGVPVEYIEPAEGRVGWVCGYGISSQARDSDMAHAYLDALLAPESIAKMGDDLWYGVSNPQAIDLMDPDVVTLLQLDQPDALEHTALYQSLNAEDREKITTMWDEVKVAP